MTLQTERLRTIEQLKAFVERSAPVDCKPLDRASAYGFVRRTLVAFDYHRLGKVRRKYLREDVKTPYEKLKSLPGADRLLKDGLTFESLGSPTRSRTLTPPGRSTRPAPNCSGGSARPPMRREGQGAARRAH